VHYQTFIAPGADSVSCAISQERRRASAHSKQNYRSDVASQVRLLPGMEGKTIEFFLVPDKDGNRQLMPGKIISIRTIYASLRGLQRYDQHYRQAPQVYVLPEW